ncbi:MAG: iron-sulfur cluster assembly scaffold protein [Acidobacteria bacterium]|nr:MAG: iron-sulfur cluster assembly scaffold protein [Acidobacteriota bacterium]
MYSNEVLDHFHNPRNVGEIGAPSAAVAASNPVCGDAMKLWILVRDEKVFEAKFKVQGCVPAVACGSWLTEAIKGKTIPELAAISPEQVEQQLGGLPAASHHASMLAVAALREALEKLSP